MTQQRNWQSTLEGRFSRRDALRVAALGERRRTTPCDWGN